MAALLGCALFWVRDHLQFFLGDFRVEEPQRKPSPGLGESRESAALPGYHRRVCCTGTPGARLLLVSSTFGIDWHNIE